MTALAPDDVALIRELVDNCDPTLPVLRKRGQELADRLAPDWSKFGTDVAAWPVFDVWMWDGRTRTVKAPTSQAAMEFAVIGSGPLQRRLAAVRSVEPSRTPHSRFLEVATR